MNRRAIKIAIGLVAVLFALAFAVASRSCEGGFEVYFWAGVAVVLALLALPFTFRISPSLLACLGWSIGFACVGVVVWVGGVFAANVRFICRMF